MLHIENRKTTIVDEKVTWTRHDDTFCECCNIVTKKRWSQNEKEIPWQTKDRGKNVDT